MTGSGNPVVSKTMELEPKLNIAALVPKIILDPLVPQRCTVIDQTKQLTVTFSRILCLDKLTNILDPGDACVKAVYFFYVVNVNELEQISCLQKII